MKINWSDLAFRTYDDEIDFIVLKFNTKQATKLVKKVIEFEELVLLNPKLGKKLYNTDFRFFVLSKQTSIIYKVNYKQELITLITFWNNKREPSELEKLIK